MKHKAFSLLVLLFFAVSMQATVQPITLGEGMWLLTSRIGVTTDVIESKVCALESSLPPGCTAITQADMPFITTGPGTYCLTENVSVAAGLGISLSHSDVTIDLNGFSIDGQGTASDGITIGSADLTNIVVKNGAIRNFVDHSIELVSTMTARIENINCDREIQIFTSNNIQILGCTVNVKRDSYGIQITRCNDCLVDTCFISDADVIGISLDGAVTSRNNRISNCQLRQCDIGIALSNNIDALVEDCLIVGSSAFGFNTLSDVENCVVKNCSIAQCDIGMRILGSGNIFMDCQITQSTSFGISIPSFGTDNKFLNCCVLRTIGTGISDSVGGNFFFGNIVLESTVADYAGVIQPIVTAATPAGRSENISS